MEVLIGIVVVGAVVWWLIRRAKHEPTSFTPPPERPQVRRVKGGANWVPLGEPVSVHGLVLPGGVYVGEQLEAVNGYGPDPALIDPRLPIDLRRPDTAGEQMGYWPSYSNIAPASRGAYLQWLAAGRPGGAYIGYVFLFFYGIERRVLADAAHAETPALLAEVERLLDSYGHNGSFAGYAGDFLSTARLVSGPRKVSEMTPPSTTGAWEVPFIVRVAAGAVSAGGEPLPAEWALAWARNSPTIPLRTPAKRCPEELAELFEVRYRQAYGEGLVIKPNKTTLQFEYRPASASFSGARVEVDTGGLPDVTRLAGPTKKLTAVIEAATNDLDGYSRCLGRHPEPDRARESARAALAELRDRVADGEPVTVTSDDLARVIAADGKVSKSAAAAARALLAAHGLAVEPAEFGKGTHAVLWRDDEASTPAGDGFAAATVLLHLGVMVSASDGDISTAEERHLEGSLETAFALPPTGRRRLRAHLAWLLAERPGIAGIKGRVAGLESAQRELIARYLLAVAGSDGHVSRSEVNTLRKLYGTLGLDPEAVHRDLHALAATDAPVAVLALPAEQGDVPVPGEVVLDQRRLADVLSSTDQVAKVLGAVFEEEAEPEAIEEPEPDDSDAIAGLDLQHTALVHRLAAREVWPRADFDALAGEHELLPGGALETINDAAFDVAGAPLLEGDDPVELDGEVLKELMDA